jgi:hypothetical protein
MSNKEKVIDKLAEVIGSHLPMTPQDACHGIAQGIVDAILSLTQKPRTQKPSGSQVWEAYVEAYVSRYGFEPKRNARANKKACELVQTLGAEDAVRVVKFFVAQSDSFLVRTMHQLEHCRGGELYSKIKAGKTITRRSADKIESAQATLNASGSYLARKYKASNQGGQNE